ncbi:MAG: hypothetical protein JWO95_433 [Verrucomicrobiales bacterium]|nr:hypothetical protein [Verrucomicrobiales bacterium]
MGLLNKFFKTSVPELNRIPSGSFTLDGKGNLVSSTVPTWFPPSHLHDIGQNIVAIFRDAQQAQLQLSELIVHYGALKIIARELRGGAIIFLSPKAAQSPVALTK